MNILANVRFSPVCNDLIGNIPNGLLDNIIANIKKSIVAQQKVVKNLQKLNKATQGVLATDQATGGEISNDTIIIISN